MPFDLPAQVPAHLDLALEDTDPDYVLVRVFIGGGAFAGITRVYEDYDLPAMVAARIRGFPTRLTTGGQSFWARLDPRRQAEPQPVCTSSSEAMSNSHKLSEIRQIAITVEDVAGALMFYRDILGLDFLFSPSPHLAFLDACGIRIMLTTPQGAGSVGKNSVLYFTVSDIAATHQAIVSRGAESERSPALVAQMEDHELWASFVRDPDGNLVGLMEEKR